MNAAASKPGHASRHWKWQRATAVALIPLTLWFVFSILTVIGDSHAAAHAWVSQPGVTVALIAYLGAMFWHAQLGLQVVVEDYVAAESTRARLLLAARLINSVAAAAAVAAVLRIALSP